MSSTDSIFKEISASSRSMKAVNLDSLEKQRKPKTKRTSSASIKKRKDVKKALNLDALSIHLPTDVGSVAPKQEDESGNQALAENSLVDDILDMCRANANGDDLDVVLAAGGDSDDDDEEDDDTTLLPLPPNERRWTIDRFNSALNDESKQKRVEVS